MLVNAPEIIDVLPRFLDFIGDSVIVGHNVTFDLNFIYDKASEYLGIRIENDYIDTVRMSRIVNIDYPNHKLSTLKKRMNICVDGQHRSLCDCQATYMCYEQMKNTIRDKNIDLSSYQGKRQYAVHSKDITTTKTDFDISHPLYGKTCVFTGVLEKMVRKDAMQIIVDLGGICGDRVTKETNFLILGNNDYCKSIKDGKSTKQKKAEQYILKGQDLSIIPEDVFYDMVLDHVE